MDRFVVHRRFYIPAFLTLFIAFPGSVSLANISGFYSAGAIQYWEFALIMCMSVPAYAWLIYSNKPTWVKIVIGTCLNTALVGLHFARIRDGDFRIATLDVIFELSTFRSLLPFMIIFYLLSYLDTVKRAITSVVVLYVLAAAFFIFELSKGGLEHRLDLTILKDVKERIILRDYLASSELVDQCARVLSQGQRAECIYTVSENFKFENCSKNLGSDVNSSCALDLSKRHTQPNEFAPIQAGVQ